MAGFWDHVTPKNITVALGLLNAVVNFPMAVVLLSEKGSLEGSATLSGLLASTIMLSTLTVVTGVVWAVSECSTSRSGYPSL